MVKEELSFDVLDFFLMDFLHVDSENIVDYKCDCINKKFNNKPTYIVSVHFEFFGEEYKLQERDFILVNGNIYESYNKDKNQFVKVQLSEAQKQSFKTLLNKHNLEKKTSNKEESVNEL